MPQGPRPSGGAGSSEAPVRGSSTRDPENADSRQRRLPKRHRCPCQTRLDTNSCLLILEPGLLWPGFWKAPARRAGGAPAASAGRCPSGRSGLYQSRFNRDEGRLWQKITEIGKQRRDSRVAARLG